MKQTQELLQGIFMILTQGKIGLDKLRQLQEQEWNLILSLQ